MNRMTPINKQLILRIGTVSLVLSLVLGFFSYYLAIYGAERFTVGLAIQTARQLIEKDGPFEGDTVFTKKEAEIAVKNLVIYGFFDVVEIYDKNWMRLGEYGSDASEAVHQELGMHGSLNGLVSEATHEVRYLNDGRRVFNVVVPLGKDGNASPRGYLEALRIIPPWREKQLLSIAYICAVIVAISTILSGLALYPFIASLIRDREAKSKRLLKSNVLLLKSLGEAVAKRDGETGIHNYRVTLLAVRIAEAFGFDVRKMESLIVGSLLHDIGKIAIPDHILLKSGKLSEQEFEIMKTHVSHGEDIVKNREWLHDAHDIVSGHHERWDGAGYPRGLAGNQIPLAARIFAVADVFDALCSKRPYKEAFDYETALSIIQKGSGSHFDPEVVQAFLTIVYEQYQKLKRSSEKEVHQDLDGCISRYLTAQLS
ncbi:HD-GYP domain-containing protein [Polynucleobacter sp. UB-Tiil-W10]|uniref:HD-GYP domain-containing protein n=1 Tax=Polynucleobacter sp. UB-Tiil-W10 TaxID=1855648 RepID=UPI001C0B87A4|nr:HD-GYP domain-containing protein [Polynucleobacter sp. UB-Tiil-W10]